MNLDIYAINIHIFSRATVKGICTMIMKVEKKKQIMIMQEVYEQKTYMFLIYIYIYFWETLIYRRNILIKLWRFEGDIFD